MTATAFKRRTWLAVAVGWLVQLGVKGFLPIAVLVGVRVWAETSGNPSPWVENPDDSAHPLWYALQASVFIGSIAAGALAARLAPRRGMALPAALLVLSLLSTAFEQFPRPLTPLAALLWAGGPCAGLLLGVWLSRRRINDPAG